MIVSHDRHFSLFFYRSEVFIIFALRLALRGSVKKSAVHSLLSQCIVNFGSTNYTALRVTGYSEDPSAVLVVDELQRYVVERRCCKRQSGLRNWRLCTPLLTPHTRIWTRCSSSYPKLLLPTSGPFQEQSTLHILDTQRVCSVGLTTVSANLCSLLREYHRIFLTS